MSFIRCMMKFLLRFYFSAFHRLEVTGLENLKNLNERAVFAVNHLSFLDGLLVAAYLPANPIFAIDTDQAKRFWYLNLFIDLYPVDPMNPMSAKGMIKTIRTGRQLVIFPEGRITLKGNLMKVYGGPATIADKSDAVIVPIKIDGLQFHKFSRMGGILKQSWFPKLYMHVMPSVDIKTRIDDNLVGTARKKSLRVALQDIMIESGFVPNENESLFKALVKTRNRYSTGQVIIADVKKFRLTYDDIIKRSIILGRKLKTHTKEDEYVGVLLPNSTTCVTTFFALHAYNRIPDMSNYSSGVSSFLATIEAATVNTIITSREFVTKAKLEKHIAALKDKNVLYVEDIRDSVSILDKLAGWVISKFVWVLPGYHSNGHAPAVVLNTSGSEGTPKGVVLSHSNILSNHRQICSVMSINPLHKFLTALPMFHSMGLSSGTLLPLFNGAYTFLYPSPLHYGIVPEVIYQEQATVFFATNSFLKGYARKAEPEDFESVDYIVAGAEAVDNETREIYAEKYQKVIYEGYGATECAPVIALNTPTHFKRGTVGRMLPGMKAKFVDVSGVGQQLYVKGPNVMLGYLKVDNPGVLQELGDNWYDTGDIFTIVGNNFLKFTDRAKRIAKIAGEMISLLATEAFVTSVWKEDQHAVIPVTDSKKGQALVLVTTNKNPILGELLVEAKRTGVSELFVPRTFITVDKIPLLGSGKFDYPAIKALVEEQLG